MNFGERFKEFTLLLRAQHSDLASHDPINQPRTRGILPPTSAKMALASASHMTP